MKTNEVMFFAWLSIFCMWMVLSAIYLAWNESYWTLVCGLFLSWSLMKTCEYIEKLEKE